MINRTNIYQHKGILLKEGYKLIKQIRDIFKFYGYGEECITNAEKTEE